MWRDFRSALVPGFLVFVSSMFGFAGFAVILFASATIECKHLRPNLIPLRQFTSIIGKDDHPLLLGRHDAGCVCEGSARRRGGGEGDRS
jgi:hypothetical protein